MARSRYKNHFIFASAELNEANHQWKPTVSIFWKTTTQKFHSINDLAGSFETENEAIAYASQAGKAWIDSQPAGPARGPGSSYASELQKKAARNSS